jgi:hypothetical protein
MSAPFDPPSSTATIENSAELVSIVMATFKAKNMCAKHQTHKEYYSDEALIFGEPGRTATGCRAGRITIPGRVSYQEPL